MFIGRISAKRRLASVFLLLALFIHPALAEEKASTRLNNSGLPVPRFVSLKSDKVHVRVGPGKDYPIDWIFVRRGLPVEIVAEYDVWRKIRDYQGTEGWVHQQRLTGKRMIVSMGDLQPLYRRADKTAAVLAKVEPGVVGRLLSCEKDWCRVEVGGYRGYLPRTKIWGVYANEKID